MKVFLVICATLLLGGVFALVYTLLNYAAPEEGVNNPIPEQLARGQSSNETTLTPRANEDLLDGEVRDNITEVEHGGRADEAHSPAVKPPDQKEIEANQPKDAYNQFNESFHLTEQEVKEIALQPHQPIADVPHSFKFFPKPGIWERLGRIEVQKTRDQEARVIERKLTQAIKYVKGKYVVIDTSDEKGRRSEIEVLSYDSESKVMRSSLLDSEGSFLEAVGVSDSKTRTVHWKSFSTGDAKFGKDMSITCSKDGLSARLKGRNYRQGVLLTIFTGQLKWIADLPQPASVQAKSELTHHLLSTGLVAHYPFNGNPRNEAGNEHHGSVVGAKLTVDRHGKANGAYQFKLGDYVKIDGLMGEPKSLTLAAWAKLEGQQGSMGAEIVSIGDYVTLRMDNRQTDHNSGTGGLLFTGRTGGNYWVHSMAKANYTDTGWHHLVFTFDDDAGKQVTYVDGQTAASAQSQKSIVYNGLGQSTFFGIHGSKDPKFMSQGVIDDIRIYDRPLSSEEVLELFLKEKPAYRLQAGKKIEAISLDEWRGRAQAGDLRAQFQMGLKAMNGVDGLERNPLLAEKWWLRAAKQGHGFAQMNLGMLYSRGTLGKKDPAKAYQWAKLSLTHGNGRAEQLVEKLEAELNPDQITEAEAFVKAFKIVRENAGVGLIFPEPMKNRRSGKARAVSMVATGGQQQTFDAISRGLEWLKANQDVDGSWGANDKRLGQPFSTDKNAMTGMALLCFLGHGQTQDSPEFGATVRKAIEFLISTPPEDPGITQGNRGAYSHPIRTYALCEAYAMTKQRKLEPFAKKATEAIIKGQHESGGWAYGYRKGAIAHVDLSVTGWNVQALKAATLTGIGLDGLGNAMDKAIAYVKRCQDSTGKFAYKEGTRGKASLTGAGVLCLQLWNNAKSHEAQKGLEWIVNNQAEEWSRVNLYEWYYHAQACFQANGVNGWKKYWKAWNENFQEILLEAQADDGHWPQGAHFHGDTDLYRTTMTILMLEVYYRYLPFAGSTPASGQTQPPGSNK